MAIFSNPLFRLTQFMHATLQFEFSEGNNINTVPIHEALIFIEKHATKVLEITTSDTSTDDEVTTGTKTWFYCTLLYISTYDLSKFAII